MKDYGTYRTALNGFCLPLAYVDMDLLDANISHILNAAGKTAIRIASKSVRCTHLLRYILDFSPRFCGLMTFSIDESLFLAEQGFDNLLIGYPETHPRRLAQLVQANRDGKNIIPMVDCAKHVQLISEHAHQHQFVQPVCIDIDMSSRFPLIHFGVHRSPIDSLTKFQDLLQALNRLPGVSLGGVMGYEAQIAGVGDKSPYQRWGMNSLIRWLKGKSISELTHRRQECIRLARETGQSIGFVNGGGTGSIRSTVLDSSVTELTVGSGFYSPGLFDNYKDFRYQPAAGFALEVTRRSAESTYTLAGGGYIASGSIGPDKRPTPHLPKGIRLFPNEGAGEVQTPISYAGNDPLEMGAPVLFRHAKAGELCERFNQLHLIRGDQVIDSVPTYRGQGQCFL